MCGIIAIYCKNKEDNKLEIFQASNILSNRGPDCSCFITDKTMIMGFSRLSIVDKTDKGMQPFEVDGVKMMCNGEIYNHELLEKKYNLSCKSKSDCECIIHLYKKVGFEQTIKLLNGDFACVIIDGGNMYFARDRIGVRPLFYGRTTSGNIAVASYARALTKYCYDVVQMKPGLSHYNSNTDKITFSSYSYEKQIIAEEGVRELIQRTLISSVKSRLMSDRPIACLLSGGLDSSLVASILCKLVGHKNVRTYSIGIEGSHDLLYAQKVATFLKTKHEQITFTPQQGFDAIPDVIRDLESYDITTIRASIPMWILAKWISEHTDNIVLMSGEGADELFCGYLYFHYAPSSEGLENESFRLVNNLYLYDALRADRCISSNGLELRVPFLDRSMIDMCLSISGDLRKPKNGMEKHLLRTSFVDNYLPDDVLWRRKEAFSDGVSGTGKKWYEQIQEFVEDIIPDDIFDTDRFPSKEAQFYRMLYNNIFPTYQPTYDYWLPKWSNHGGDPSACVLEIYPSKEKTDERKDG